MSQTDPASWSPGLTPDQLWSERSYLAGILIGAVAYGVHATLFFTALTLLWARPRSHWRDYTWIAYIVTLFVVSSLANGGQFKFTQMIWIDNRNYPGGPGAYFIEQSATPSTICNAAYIVNGWFQDGLIIYRFWVIYNRNVLAIIGPCIAFVGELVVSLMLLIALTTGGKVLNSEVSVNLLTAYFAISVAMNVLLTLAIVLKLVLVRRRIGHLIASSSQYVSVSAILIESAALYAVCGIIFLVPWELQDPVQQLVLPTLGQVESIAPLLIIMRVAQGRAWDSDTATRLGSASSTNTFKMTNRTDATAVASMTNKGGSTTKFNQSSWAQDDEESGVNVHEDVEVTY